MSLQTALKNVPFFSRMQDSELALLVKKGRVQTAGARQVIFQQGDQADCLYVILEGRVKIFLCDEKGTEVIVKTAEPGDVLGEMALLDGSPRSASAATLEPCQFFILDRESFFSHLDSSPHLVSQLFTHFTGTIRETTEKFFREELAKHTLRAEMELDRHRAMAQMVAGVAHELNTPLGIINTAASIVRRELHGEGLAALCERTPGLINLEDVREALDLMQRQINRAHALIQSFKNISASHVADTKEPMDLPEAVSEMITLFEFSDRKAKLEIALDAQLPREDRTWVGYRGHLSSIVLNLLSNVERYAYPGTPGGKARVILRMQGGAGAPAYILSVQDFGRGIPREVLPKVFDPFFTTGRAQGGTGLGLAIVHSLATSVLKGSVVIQSEFGKGTTATVIFPKAVPD